MLAIRATGNEESVGGKPSITRPRGSREWVFTLVASKEEKD